MGRVSFRDRDEGSVAFHYSLMPTCEYREKFGRLHYFAPAGTQVAVTSSDAMEVTRGHTVLIHGENGDALLLPPEILDAGRADVTAMIHSEGPSWWFGHPRFRGVLKRLTWPRESGGSQTLARLVELAHEQTVDFERLREIARPELDRQRSSIRSAIARVVDLVYP